MNALAPPPRPPSLRTRLARAAVDLAGAGLLVRRGPARHRRLALTFDDGPDDLTPAYLDLLDNHGAQATFFVVGRAAAAHPDALAAIARRGHEVAAHGYTHRTFPRLGARALDDELRDTAALLPGPPRFLRPPQGALTVRTLLRCARRGYTTVLWSVDSNDCRTRSAADVSAAMRPDRLTPGDIVLLHEGQSWTLAALAENLPRLKNAGFALVTVGELLT